MQGHQCVKGTPNWSTDGTVLCIHVLPLKSFLHLYIYIYLYRGKQTIYKLTDIQTYPNAYSNTLQCI